MPGRSLTRPCPGTGRRPHQSVSAGPPPLSYSARVRTRLSVRSSRWQFSRSGWVTVLARCPGREWETSALRASVDGSVSTAPCLRRPHCAGATLGHACFVSCLRHHPWQWAAALTRPPHQCADRLCYCATAVRSGYDAHACASGPPLHRRAQRTDCPGGWAVTPSFQFVALHSVTQPSANRPASSPLLFVPFLSLKLRRHGGEMLAALALS